MTAPSKPAGKAPADMASGDYVYADHPQHGAMVVKVLASGKDGFTAEDGAGARHKIKHEGYLGHKTRSLHTYKVVDEGADGTLMEDDTGKRRFLTGKLPTAAGGEPSQPSGTSSATGHTDDPLLDGLGTFKKAMPPPLMLPDGLVLLLKAMPGRTLANRPGLSQKLITDRKGRRSNRWVRTVKDQPKERQKAAVDETSESRPGAQDEKKQPPLHKHGDDVTFRHGDVRGHGKIVASGQDGVTVQTPDGREHQVRHDALEAPTKYPDRKDGEDDKAYLKRSAKELPSPKNMPEEHDRFFNMKPDTQTIPMDQLVSTKSDAENAKGGENAPKFMMASYHGHVAKRDPITVEKTPDGKYKVVDGNGTFTGAKAAGWKALPVTVQGDDATVAGEVKTLFDDPAMKSLPDKANQPVKTKEELYAKAAEAQDQLQTWLNKGKGVASSLGYETMKGPPEDADMGTPGGMLFIAPLKSEKRATEKVDDDYGGDWSQLLDPVRASMAVDSYDELARAMGALTASGMKLARKPKDRFTKPLPVGYRDALLNVTLPNGLIGELQLHVKPMLKAKGDGHKHYEVERTLQSKKVSGLSDEEHATLQAAIESQTAIYNEAWATATGGNGATGKDEGAMAKAMKPMGRKSAKAAAGKKYTFFDHDGASFRRLEKPPFRAIDDVLHGQDWVPYSGDRLKPGLFGEEIPDPLGNSD